MEENSIISRLNFVPHLVACKCGHYHKVKFTEDKQVGWIKCKRQKLDNIIVYKDKKCFNPYPRLAVMSAEEI